ncbi:MAG: hypothetical protein ABI600_11550 [Luteolibacter sp.]
MDPFIESEMTFGPYPDGHCFRVETSDTYKAVQNGVKMVEFLLLRSQTSKPPVVWIVEAKPSSPDPKTQPKFREFIRDIHDKLSNGLGLGIAAILKRHPKALVELPELFKNLDLEVAEFRLVLVINGHEESWCAPLQDALRKELHAVSKVWALGPNAVIVINHERAKKVGLISAP